MFPTAFSMIFGTVWRRPSGPINFRARLGSTAGDIKRVRELADYWENNYDWRAQEAKINRFRQFTTEIDGQQIYFIHERSPRPDAVPLMLIHGWRPADS